MNAILFCGHIDSNGTLVVRYKYNAWGKKVLVQDATQIGIGEINPFRFKGYYYDTETGMYYCQSRYYVPEWGRWLNGDHPYYLNPSNLAGINLFAYCANDPVNYIDPTGTSIFVLIGLLIGAAIGFGVATYKDYKDDGKVFNGSVSFWEYLGSTAIGAAIGGLIGAGIGHLLAPAAGMAGTAGAMATTGTAGAIAAGVGSMAMVSVSVADIVVAAAGATSIVLLGILFSKIPFHGAPNSTVKIGGSTGIYDGNGNLISRQDTTGKAHYIKEYGERYLPHTHVYKWKFINNVWRIIDKIVLPF